MSSVLSQEFLPTSVQGETGRGAVFRRLLSGMLLTLALVPTALVFFLLDITGRFSEAYPGLGHAFSLLAASLVVLLLLSLLVGVANVQIRRTRFTVTLFLLVGLAVLLPIHPEVGTDMRTISAEWRQRLAIPDRLLDRYYDFLGSQAGMEPRRITVTAPARPTVVAVSGDGIKDGTSERQAQAELSEKVIPDNEVPSSSLDEVTSVRVINMPRSLTTASSLHEHPSHESAVVGHFPAGYGLWVLEEMSNGWLKVEHEDGVAYVNSQYF